MPELDQRARGGDAKATRLLFDRLQECVAYQREDDAEIRTRVDASYEQARLMQQKYPHFDIGHPLDDSWRNAEFSRGVDLRERCGALSRGQIVTRFDWAALALSQHDRTMTIALAGIGHLNVVGIERVRYADRLAEIGEREAGELGRLAEAGDLDAMARGALMHAADFISPVPNDPFQGYVYAYAWTLANGSTEQMNHLMDGLALGPLSAEQVVRARALGQALYQRCCRSKPSS
ncbi:MAG: hypothetical protein ABI843_08195 [Dokdonella sp.]